MDEAFEQQTRLTLLEYLGRDPAELDRAGTTVIRRERMTATGLVLTWLVGPWAFVEVEPALAEPLRQRLSGAPPDYMLRVGDLVATLGADHVRDASETLIFLVQPDELIRREPSPPLTLRRLTPEDARLVQALNEACTPEEADDGFVSADHELSYACLDGERAVSVVSGYRRNGFMDMGALTEPAYRGRRLAPAALAATCDATFALGLIPQYRCDVKNTASRRVAEVTGFRLHFRSEHARIVV